MTTPPQALQQHPLNPNPSLLPNIPQTQMLHPQQASYANFSPYTQTPNPNLNLLFPQPVLPSNLPSEPVLHPPGADPYGPASSYHLIHGGFEGQTPCCQDPNAVSQSWVVNHADPISYTTAIDSLNEKSVVSTSLNSLWNNNWMNQPVAIGVTNIVPKQTKVIQSIRCEVCNIDCNSKDAFEKHISGKKHKKKLKIHNNPTTTIVGEALETKRKKLMVGGAAVDSVRVCTICNVACNSQEVFNKHLAGKKHAAQAGIRPPNGIANPNSSVLISPTVVQSAWCEVCKIYCNSNDMLIKHKLGKKHQKNLKELEKSKNDTSTPASTDAPVTKNPIIGPTENPETNKGKSVDLKKKKASESRTPEEDLETKRRKIMESGTAAGDVRTCLVCNVMCNSQSVFISHLAGHKHAVMLKKQAEAGLTTAGPQVAATT